MAAENNKSIDMRTEIIYLSFHGAIESVENGCEPFSPFANNLENLLDVLNEKYSSSLSGEQIILAYAYDFSIPRNGEVTKSYKYSELLDMFENAWHHQYFYVPLEGAIFGEFGDISLY